MARRKEISPETKELINWRMIQQDRIIFPQRQKEGRITPEWRKYAVKRGLMSKQK